MFETTVIIEVADLNNEQAMAFHRLMLDAGAKSHQPSSSFQSEEIGPYVIEVEHSETKVRRLLPETDETRKYRVLRRFYE